MSGRGQRVGVRITHTVAYSLRCHGAMGNDVNDGDDDDDGNGVTGDKVDNCDGTMDSDVDDDDEGATGDNDNDNGNGATGNDDNSNGGTGDNVNNDGGGATDDDEDDDGDGTTGYNDDNNGDGRCRRRRKCVDTISTMCDDSDNRNRDNSEDPCALTATRPVHRQRR